MRAAIILSNINKIDSDDLSKRILIGVDRGAYTAIKMGLRLDIAIGDFDSVSEAELRLIYENSKRVIKLNPVKDLTDTASALELCRGYSDILVLGGIQGKRIEHFIANIILISNYRNVRMKDDNSLIEIHDGDFIPNLDYKYISFFSLANESIITLQGFKYPLDNYLLKNNDSLCISNEIVTNPRVYIRKGRILAIYSNNDK